jgi:hypothetical protein
MARQTFEALEPGGWIEQKFDLPLEYNEPSYSYRSISLGLVFMGARAWGITLDQGGTFYQQLLNSPVQRKHFPSRPQSVVPTKT